MRIHML